MKVCEPIIIAVVGLIGSGKTEAANRFVERGFTRIGFNDRVYEELSRQGLARTEPNERKVREEMRLKFGMAVMAERSLPLIESALRQGSNVVIESLYSWSEYKFLKQRFGDKFKVLAIYSPPEMRYARLAAREVRSLTYEIARSRDYSEVENIEKAGPIAMADWTIANTDTKDDFLRKLDLLIDEITASASSSMKRSDAAALKRPLTIAFLGRSGSGKGTQAKLLMDYLQKPLYIVTGNLFRELSAMDTVVGRKVASELKVGILPPYWLAYTLWQRELVEKLINNDQDILFDGALRRVKEAMSLDEVLAWLGRPLVVPVLIDITREEAFKRMKMRARFDDTDTNINMRLDWYEADVLPVVEHYERLGRLIKVDGMPAPEKVFENVVTALGLR